jgi:osmotically-inducible protein OsmY
MNTQEQKLKEKVERYLERDDRLSAGQIDVDVKGTNVKLDGKVKNYNALRAAENDAYMVLGVKTVDNYLSVEPVLTTEKPDDIAVEARIRNILLWDQRVDATDTEITVDKGQVEINGSVYSFWEKQLVEEVVLSVEGVVDVNNNLVVNTRHDINDELIADRVYEALSVSPYVNTDDIDVVVNNGMVTISGNVQSYMAASDAHDALLYLPGVRGIANNLSIG